MHASVTQQDKPPRRTSWWYARVLLYAFGLLLAGLVALAVLVPHYTEAPD
jgi:hypothetical protein